MIKITTIYIFTEITLLFLFCITRPFTNDICYLQKINLLPILINFIYIFPKKVDKRLKISLTLPLVADYIFLYTPNKTLGISCFILIQIGYYLYLRKKPKNTLYLFGLCNIVISFLSNKLLKIEGIIYALLSITNIYFVCKKSLKEKKEKRLKYGLILLAICDTCIATKYFFKKENSKWILDIIERICYTISQLLLLLYAMHSADKEKISSKQKELFAK